jgi:protocatechuate 3,4-dioxygenase beta subunit
MRAIQIRYIWLWFAVSTVLLAGCATKSTPPGPNSIAGKVDEAVYAYHGWEEGLRILIWHDLSYGSETCSGTGSTEDPVYRLECTVEAEDGRRLEWQVHTGDGLAADVWIEGQHLDPTQGAVFLVRALDDEVSVEQLPRDLSTLAADDEAITALAISDPDIARFVASVAPGTAEGITTAPTYVTPVQQEGPYYPVEKPAERDNNLVLVAGAPGPATGEVLSLSGVVYDTSGAPLEGVTVEIWQTDSKGIYLHPDDPGTAQRDPNFQFYGESLTGADGVYSFRTVLPGRYGSRPRHIHVKVRRGEALLLTTQFYFANEISLSGDEANLLVAMAPAEDDAGNPIWVGARDVVVRLN